MHRLPSSLLLLLAIFAAVPAARADDRWETLRAINWVENPTNHKRAGRFGELGPYQFRPSTWRMHTRKPFQLATDRAVADEVAVQHYEWIKRNLQNAGVDATAFNIALAWNSGVTNVVKGRAPNVSYNYAQRVVNLVQSFNERSEALADEARAASADVSLQPEPIRPSLAESTVFFATHPDAPRVQLAVAPANPVIEPVVYTTKDPAPAPQFLIPTATATLTPHFNLLSGLGE